MIVGNMKNVKKKKPHQFTVSMVIIITVIHIYGILTVWFTYTNSTLHYIFKEFKLYCCRATTILVPVLILLKEPMKY